MSRTHFDYLRRSLKRAGDRAIEAEMQAAARAGYSSAGMKLVISGLETRLVCGSEDLARQLIIFEGLTVRVETERLWGRSNA